MTNAHPGFKAVAKGIARRGGYSLHSSQAILANSSRHASPAAKRKNPRLNRVRNAHGIGSGGY